MNSTHSDRSELRATARSVFSRILVGVDGTEPGFEACRQAGLLADADAAIEAVAVVHLADAIWTGGDAPRVTDELQRDAEEALDRAIAILGDTARRRFVNGYSAPALLDEAEQQRVTMIAIGSHGHHRATEIVFGGVAGEILHRAPCSVLVARAPETWAAFPSSVVVGLDGSAESYGALVAAEHLAERFSVSLRGVVGLQGAHVDPEAALQLAPQAELVDEHPVEALAGAVRANDLLVVGSRGLHGVRALGSVSERIAHKAPCSVLVVRPARVA